MSKDENKCTGDCGFQPVMGAENSIVDYQCLPCGQLESKLEKQ